MNSTSLSTDAYKAERLLEYWKLSRAWRGDVRFQEGLNTGSMITKLTQLAGSAMHIGYRGLENTSANLLQEVIQNKRNRKTKPVDNLIELKLRNGSLVAEVDEIGELPVFFIDSVSDIEKQLFAAVLQANQAEGQK